MSKRLLDVWFAVLRPDGYASRLWKLWVTTKGDVYLTVKAMGGIHKYSFHTGGICRSAFTPEHGTPSVMPDRAMFKWRRAPTPPAGSCQVSRVAWIGFTTAFLSRPAENYGGDVAWIEAAPPGGATCVELSFTRDSQDTILKAVDQSSIYHRMLRYVDIPALGESFYIHYYHADACDDKGLTMPGDGKVNDLIFSTDDPYGTGRPIRVCLGPPPKDGEVMQLWEYGGYAVPPGSVRSPAQGDSRSVANKAQNP